MYEFTHEKEKREKRFKIYLLLFIVLSLINISLEIADFWNGNISGFRLFLIALGYLIVLYFGIDRKSWAEWLIMLIVIIHIILLLLLLIMGIIEWIA